MAERTYTVYCHTNKVNGKKYIGITAQAVNKRWRANGNGYLGSHQRAFASAIKKYGWDNFTHELLVDNLSQEEALKKETELIIKYHTYIGDPECQGYNMTFGGQGSLKYLTEEERCLADSANNKKYRQKRKLDLEKRSKDLECNHRWYKKVKQDSEQYQSYKEKRNAQSRLRNQDQDCYKKHLAYNADYARRVRATRKILQEMFNTSAELFTEEERSKIFDKKVGTRTYCCSNLATLSAILNTKINKQEAH